ncbi:hypothetical protein LTR53_010196, partial [Teratosphaeriaceae sp. CCFEE 6253]
MERSLSPPLPPDPRVRPSTAQLVREAYSTASSPAMQPTHQPIQAPESRLPDAVRMPPLARPAPILHQPQPVREAVHDAFEQTPVVQNQLDPELVRQVTEQVIRNLQNVAAATPTAATFAQPLHVQYAPPPPPPPAVQSVPQSPTQSSTGSGPQRQYTPPSPEKRGPEASSPSPDRIPSYSSRESRESLRSKASVRSREQPPLSIQNDGTQGVRRRTSTNTRRRQEGVNEEDRPRRRDSGSESTVRDPSRPHRRDSRDSEFDYHDAPPARSRVRPARVPSDVPETTSVEKAWQPLFDHGHPTARLGQFLHGLAIHLIDDYEPKNTLVVTPAKMLRFFHETRVPDELYPWPALFGGPVSHLSLAT